MAHCYKYVVARFSAGDIRDERLNLAILIFHGDRLDVRLPRSIDKVRSISGAVDIEQIKRNLLTLSTTDDLLRLDGVNEPSGRLDALRGFSSLTFSSFGEFYAIDTDAYERSVQSLILKLVEPEPALSREIKRRTSKLLQAVKSAFKAERVLARKGEGLENHRIVPNFKVAEGLSADLMLKNGAMHIIQTADYSNAEASVKRAIHSIAVSALVFEQARMGFGDDNTSARLIYRSGAAMESLITPSLYAAEHQGAKLINWDSRDDRTRFIVEISSLADPIIIPKRGKDTFITASTQRRLNLN